MVSPGAITMTDRTGAPRITCQPDTLALDDVPAA
jgi:hypothetical protein